MSLIILNDANRAGGSSQLDMSADGWPFTYNGQILARNFADLNTMLGEIYEKLSWNGLPYTQTPFTTTIPLSSSIPGATGLRMAAQCVTGALAFSPAASPVVGFTCQMTLIADGVHTPTFPGFTAAGGSWVNTAGTMNFIQFTTSGATCYYTVNNLVGEIATALRSGISSISLTHGVNPTLTITTNGTALNSSVLPPPTAFALTTSNPAGASFNTTVGVTATTVALGINGTVAAGDTLTLSYTPPSPTGYVTTAKGIGAIRDINGNPLAQVLTAPVTVS